MLTIFHGEDTTASRKAYIDRKKQSNETLSFDGASLTLTDIAQVSGGQDLFGDKKDIFIEELFSKKKASKELEALAKEILSQEDNVFLWESKELTAKQLSLVKGAKISIFKIPSTIFAFLDALKPNNGHQLLQLFHQTLKDKEAEFVFFMLTRHIRTLLAMQEDETPSISEVSRMAPWQKGKLSRQAKLFTKAQLLNIHQQLYDIEVGLKTGGLTLPLSDTIDFLLYSI